MNIAVLLLTRC